MYKTTKYIILLVFVLFGQMVFSINLDSLALELKNTKSDSLKIEILNTLSAASSNDNDAALQYSSKAVQLSEKAGTSTQIVNSYLSLSIVFQDIGEFNNSIEILYKALGISDSIGDQELIGKTNNNLGNAYRGIVDVEKSELYYNDAVIAYEKAGNELELGKTYNNLGLIYVRQKKLDEAINSYEKSIQIATKYNDRSAVSNGLSNLGVAYYYRGEIDKTISYFEQSLEIDKELDSKMGVAISLSNIGELYIEIDKEEEALVNLLNSVKYAKEVNAQDLLKHTYLIISQVYEKKGNHKQALIYFQSHSSLKDSIVGLEKSKYAIELEAQYESSNKEKKILELEKLQATQALELTEKKLTQNVLIGSVLIIILILIIFISRYNSKRKANEVLKLYTNEIEEKNSEITDSIVYAKRIQAAILPPSKLVKEYLKDSFIIYQPKDIVAGDFYWLEHKNDQILFAVADCTGHGVPGAMVSVVCNNALNRSVREYGLTEPGLILDKSREIVIQEFDKSDEDVNDGMDIALCTLNKYTLQYAGANNPLWIIRDDEIIEIKATKQPIGKYQSPKKYVTHTVELKKNDSIYLFSDGFVDQFGGEKGKKFKTANFKEMLISIQHESMQKQKELILSTFHTWKGNVEQVDDVCVMGVKIT